MANEATVSLADLQDIKKALDASKNQNEAWDIFDNYRKLNGRFQWSALTRSLTTTIKLVEGLIEEAEEDEDEG